MGGLVCVHRVYSRKFATPPPNACDPFNLDNRFVETHRQHFATALREIKNGQKHSHWSWYIWPTPPYTTMFGKFEREVSLSMTNRFYALRDPPPNDLRGNQAAIAYLQHPESPDGINLRRNYIVIMDAVARQLEAGADADTLIGEVDVPKIKSSVALFEQAAIALNDAEVEQVCKRVKSALMHGP